jgi:peroxiredoxin
MTSSHHPGSAPSSTAALAGASEVAYPPETIEGWYVLHQLYRIDPARRAELRGDEIPEIAAIFAESGDEETRGWSAAVRIIGSTSDVMFMHFRRTLDEIGAVQRTLAAAPWMVALVPTYSFLSVTESGLYYLTSQLAKAALARGGKPGDAQYLEALHEKTQEELQSAHTLRRLYPPRPAAMPYVSFYPMSKRRAYGQNWYALPLDERSLLMRDHGLTGRKYSGRVQQVISGAIGFDAWEWGVTLFAANPLEFKKIVTEMRFDEASAKYGEFGDFYVGKIGPLSEVLG